MAPTSQAFVDVFASEPERVVYLCAESDTELTQLDPDNIYVVGALVDHNQHKARALAMPRVSTARRRCVTTLR